MSHSSYKQLVLFLVILIIFGWPNFTTSQSGSVLSTVRISICGSNYIDDDEICDGTDLAGNTCQTFGFTHGNLYCSSACDEFITSSCYTPPTPPPGGGGGGGGAIPSPTPVETRVNLAGKAYPLSEVSVLKDGQLIVETLAGPDANFNASVAGLSSGNYTFSVFSKDKFGIRSSLFTFPIYITSGVTTSIGGIFISPTIAVDKSEVKLGDNIAIFGQSKPNSEITININSEEEIFVIVSADDIGVYLYNFDTARLTPGEHSARAKSALSGNITPFSKKVAFLVDSKNVVADPEHNIIKGDLNKDGKVNLVDFSIAAYWYKRPLSESFKIIEAERLNGDAKVDLVDFSIMAYYWTG